MQDTRSGTTTLTVWRFDTSTGAQQASNTLAQLARADLVRITDAAVVEWEQGKRNPKTRPLHDLAGDGALGGAFWGMLFGLIFFVPLLGAAVGAAVGAAAGSLTDVGIDDQFINRIRDQVTPGTSALFVLSSDAVVDRIKEAFGGHRPELLLTDLTGEQEAALRGVFAE